MGILSSMSDEAKKEYRQKKLNEIREYNKDLIDDLGIDARDFNMKRVFTDKNGKIVVSIFHNEFLKKDGFYFELIDGDLEPNDPERTVYRLSPSKHYHEEYESDGVDKYLVPVEHLRIVNRQSATISKKSASSSSDKVFKEDTSFFNTLANAVKPNMPVFKNDLKIDDEPISELTIRDYLAIHTGRPVSKKSWLNELLKIK